MMKKLILFVFMLMFSLVGVNAVLTTDNELYYSFDDIDLSGSNPLDLSVNGNNGTNNGATTGATGKLNQSFNFDGSNDDIDIPTSITTSIISANSFTINTWVNPDVSANQIIRLGDGGTNLGYALGFDISANKLRGFIGYSGTSPMSISTASISTGVYTMVSFTYDGTTIKTYINGVQDGSASAPSPTWSVGTDAVIGSNGVSAFFDGDIDEFGIWDRDLSSVELLELYNNVTGFNPYSPILPVLSFQNITADNITLINNTIYNDSIQFETIILNTSTNSNVNHSYSLNGATLVQYATNTLNGSIELNLSEGFYNISFQAINNETSINSTNYSFLVDRSAPNISIIGNLSQPQFEVDFSTIFNVTDDLLILNNF